MTWKNGPYSLAVQAGQVIAYCTCRLSHNPPFCDGSHEAIGLAPMLEKFSADAQVKLCGCGKSGDRPFCDGSHNALNNPKHD